MIEGISHIYFETNNYKATKAFWLSLGFTEEMDLTHKDGQQGGLFKGGGLTFMLKEVEGKPHNEIYFAMSNPEQVAKALAAKTPVKVVEPLNESHWGTQLIRVADPDGRTFYLEAGHD